MSRPLIQIDNDGNAREMTDEELEAYETMLAGSPTVPSLD